MLTLLLRSTKLYPVPKFRSTITMECPFCVFLPLAKALQEGVAQTLEIKEWREDFLISYHGEGNPECGFSPCVKGLPLPYESWHSGDAYNNSYHCIRSMVPPEIYCAFDDDENFIEYYDLEADPWQLNNTADALSPEIRSAFEMRLSHLRNCHGPSCYRKQQQEDTSNHIT